MQGTRASDDGCASSRSSDTPTGTNGMKFAVGLRSFLVGATAIGSTICPQLGAQVAPPSGILVLQSDSQEAQAIRRDAATRLPYSYRTELPAHFKTIGAERFDNLPPSNPVTDAGATLGRFIFHDTRVSADKTLSCASCHDQAHGFSDPNRFSRGFDGQLTERKAMNLVNIRYHPRGRFFWDERAATLEEAVLEPMKSRVELGGTVEGVVAALAADDSYRPLFKAVYGTEEVNRERVGQALSQFLRSLISCQSKYDEGVVQATHLEDDFPNFSAEENRGKRVFLASCATCHMRLGQGAHFALLRPMNNGLDDDIGIADGGVGDVSLNARELGIFKSPGLRNVEVTGPYMHDGRFNTLEEVVEHYSTGVKVHPHLGTENLRRFNFDAGQKGALVAFLRTLTDTKFLSDPRFSNPYRVPATRLTVAATQPTGASAPEIQAWLMTFDTNRDGAIDTNEAKAIGAYLEQRGFARGPRGRLTLQREGDGRNLGGGLSAIESSLRSALNDLDLNGDDRLDEPEVGPSIVALGDTNHDGALDRSEMNALAERYQKEAIPSELREPVRRALLARSPAAAVLTASRDHNGNQNSKDAPNRTESVFASADSNHDGELDSEELRRLERECAIDVTMYLPGAEGFNGDRLYAALAPLKLTPQLQRQIADIITTHQKWLSSDADEQRVRLLGKLEVALGTECFEKFQSELASGGERRGGNVIRRKRTADDLSSWLFTSFDRNENRRLEAEEVRVVALRLQQMPGGVDIHANEQPEELADREDGLMTSRMHALDRNGDGRVSQSEMPDRLRSRFLEFDIDKSGDLDAREIEAMLEGARRRAPRQGTDSRPTNLASPLMGVALARVLTTERVSEVLDRMSLSANIRERADAVLAPIDDQRHMDGNRRILMKKLVDALGPELGEQFKDHLAEQEIHPDRHPPMRRM